MFLGTTLAVLYLFLIFTVASITFRKGHFVLGFLGIILPFLWLIGAVLPDRNEGMTSGTGQMTPSM
jgi:4-amino-4-deoxy-L-arabinose transferase-like glycosyltransferase